MALCGGSKRAAGRSEEVDAGTAKRRNAWLKSNLGPGIRLTTFRRESSRQPGRDQTSGWLACLRRRRTVKRMK